MADLKVTQLTDLGAMAAADDYMMVVDVSDTTMSAGGTNKKMMVGRVGRTNGAVLYTQDAKELTVPATGTAALRGVANTFVAQQDFAPTSGFPIQITTLAAASPYALNVASFDNGANPGPFISIGRNSNASTAAAGSLRMLTNAGGAGFVWVDGSALLRIHSAAPTSATDTAGSVIGDQTSSLAAKDLLPDTSSLAEIRARLAAGGAAVRRFVYKSGAYNNQEFEGVVVDYAAEYGKDRDEEHPAGKALNEISILGDLLRAIVDLEARVTALETA